MDSLPDPRAVPGRAAPLRVAVAGLGFGEKVHLPALAACALTEPMALWHPRSERLEKACAASGLPGFSDFDALLADPSIEAVVIATPPGPRFDLAKAAIAAGKHLLLEKPVGLNADQVQELQRLALAAGLCVGVDFEYRAVPLFQQLAALLHQGAIGTPWLVKLDWLMGSRADPLRPWSWYSQSSGGGGVLGALGTHAFDTLHWLIGPTRELSATCSTAITERPLAKGKGAETGAAPGREPAMAPVDAEDIALVQVNLGTASGQSVPAQVSLASVARPGRGYWIEIYGSEGSLVLGSSNQSDYVHGFQLWQARPGEGLQLLEPDPQLAFERTWVDGRVAPVQRILHGWASAVREGKPMVPGLSEAVLSQVCCDLALRSARDGLRLRP
ncbi:MAG: Gfo/Idh/MocA family oxidoreductase [Cyanobacteria bacterium]|nr:Gfo/Idh/MocA family oxidoreductase [Cyanobacteriota bacterium]